MEIVKCSYDGCERVFEKPTLNQAEQALRMHIARTHTKKVIPQMKNPIKRARKIQRKTRRKNGLHNSKSNSVSINYCPCCGFDMHGLAVAIVMSSELK